MTALVPAPRVVEDFEERIVDPLVEHGNDDAATRIDTILAAVAVLGTSAEIGRPMDKGMRELVIGRGSRGNVARYRYLPRLDTVIVLAVRGWRERPFGEPACSERSPADPRFAALIDACGFVLRADDDRIDPRR